MEININFDAVRDTFLEGLSYLMESGLDLINYAEDRVTDLNNVLDEKFG